MRAGQLELGLGEIASKPDRGAPEAAQLVSGAWATLGLLGSVDVCLPGFLLVLGHKVGAACQLLPPEAGLVRRRLEWLPPSVGEQLCPNPALLGG